MSLAMALAIAISIFFGLVAAFVLQVLWASGRRAIAEGRAILAELAAMDHAAAEAVSPCPPRQSRQRQAALAAG